MRILLKSHSTQRISINTFTMADIRAVIVAHQLRADVLDPCSTTFRICTYQYIIITKLQLLRTPGNDISKF